MTELRLHKRILSWGNSYGIRITRGELKDMALEGQEEGQEVEITIKPVGLPVNWTKIQTFRWGADASQEIDKIVGRGLVEDSQSTQTSPSSTQPRGP